MELKPGVCTHLHLRNAESARCRPHGRDGAARRHPARRRSGTLRMQAADEKEAARHADGAAGDSAADGAAATTPPAAAGLRKLSLPTVGGTHAAAETAAARREYDDTPPSSGAAPAPAAMDQERTSYFKRLSTLPPADDATKTLPAPVLKFLDATRGVLFALTQIYTALRQHLSVVTDERLAAPFQRILGNAGVSMSPLIAALDRYDALSQRGTPDGSAIRSVLSVCTKSLHTFRRVVAVLQEELPTLQQGVDARFSRTLLLMLYGSIAELQNSGATMSAHIQAVLPYVGAPGSGQQAAAAAAAARHRTSRSQGQQDVSLLADSTLSDTAEETQSMVSASSSPSAQSATRAKTRYGAAGGTPYLRSPGFGSARPTPGGRSPQAVSTRKSPPPMTGAASSWGAAGSMPTSASLSSISRLQHSSSGSSLRDSLVSRSTTSGTPGTPATDLLASPPTNAAPRAVDEQLLNLLAHTTDTAVHVWTELHEHVQAAEAGRPEGALNAGSTGGAPAESTPPRGGISASRRLHDIDEMSVSTLDLTRRVQSTLHLVQDAPEGPEVHKLWEQTHHFVRAIIHISTLIKAVAPTCNFPRELMRAVGEVNQGCLALAVHLHHLQAP